MTSRSAKYLSPHPPHARTYKRDNVEGTGTQHIRYGTGDVDFDPYRHRSGREQKTLKFVTTRRASRPAPRPRLLPTSVASRRSLQKQKQLPFSRGRSAVGAHATSERGSLQKMLQQQRYLAACHQTRVVALHTGT